MGRGGLCAGLSSGSPCFWLYRDGSRNHITLADVLEMLPLMTRQVGGSEASLVVYAIAQILNK
jgi:hypothetical protein